LSDPEQLLEEFNRRLGIETDKRTPWSDLQQKIEQYRVLYNRSLGLKKRLAIFSSKQPAASPAALQFYSEEITLLMDLLERGILPPYYLREQLPATQIEQSELAQDMTTYEQAYFNLLGYIHSAGGDADLKNILVERWKTLLLQAQIAMEMKQNPPFEIQYSSETMQVYLSNNLQRVSEGSYSEEDVETFEKFQTDYDRGQMYYLGNMPSLDIFAQPDADKLRMSLKAMETTKVTLAEFCAQQPQLQLLVASLLTQGSILRVIAETMSENFILPQDCHWQKHKQIVHAVLDSNQARLTIHVQQQVQLLQMDDGDLKSSETTPRLLVDFTLSIDIKEVEEKQTFTVADSKLSYHIANPCPELRVVDEPKPSQFKI